MKINLKKHLIPAGCVVFFLLLVCAFVPDAVFNRKIVRSVDITGYIGMSQEARQWDREHPDDKTAWTGSMFGGMPTIMLTGNDKGDWIKPVFETIRTAGHRPASYLFISLLGAFLLMLSLGIRPLLAAGGAVAVTFCSYNMQIIQIGHNTKMLALAYFPWVLAAVVYTYRKALAPTASTRKEWLPVTALGAVLFAFALAFQVKADHVQITWYLALVIGIYVLALLIWILSDRDRMKAGFGRFVTASLLLLVLGGIGIATSASKLIPVYAYSSQTMRGGSDLSGGEKKGLDLDYVTSWSYGWNELPNMMIPNLNGGSSSSRIQRNTHTFKALQTIGEKNLKNEDKTVPLYWGGQPFTSGPMYMGAISVFLFLLGLLLYDGKEKWWLLAATLVAIGLGLGSHLMPLTRFFYRWVPFYSKFRAVSMSLVILQFTLPILGFLLLERLMAKGIPKREFLRKGGIALALTAGVCLLLALFPSLAGSFTAAGDAGKTPILQDALVADRRELLQHDAWVSFWLISATFVLLWWALSGTQKRTAPAVDRKTVSMVLICGMILVNLFTVGKRYLNASHFSSVKQFDSQFVARTADQEVLKDTNPDYRVLDLTVNIFNDSFTSYWHKSIGGYSPVKLQRYQDLIDHYLRDEIKGLIVRLKEMESVGDYRAALKEIPLLNALNTKYFIVNADNAPLLNSMALGNAWFVKSALMARTPDEEIALLAGVPLRDTAILGPDMDHVTMPTVAASWENDGIRLTSYAPNEVRYAYHAASPRAAVFSEVYYPGWKATLEDGTPVDIFRADWTLRGAILPAGNHELVMRFEPRSYALGSNISRIASGLLYLILLLGGIGLFIKRRNEKKDAGN